MNNKLVYLAVPYTPKGCNLTAEEKEALKEKRFRQVTKVSGLIASCGVANFSPITQSHEQSKVCKLPTTWDFWANIDIRILKACDELWVLCLDGVEDSVGVQSEISVAKALGKPIRRLRVEKGKLNFHVGKFPGEISKLCGEKI